MKATVAIVIVGDETNTSLSWTRDFPPVLLTDELTVSEDHTQDECNHFGRVAVRGKQTWQVIAANVGKWNYWNMLMNSDRSTQSAHSTTPGDNNNNNKSSK